MLLTIINSVYAPQLQETYFREVLEITFFKYIQLFFIFSTVNPGTGSREEGG